MDTILKGGLLTLLVVMISGQAAAVAGSAEGRNGLAFSQAETAMQDELDNERGKGGVDYLTLNGMNLKAELSGNEANNTVTGYNVIDSGAFANAVGINSVIQNTGNNVLIQDATIVNVTIMP